MSPELAARLKTVGQLMHAGDEMPLVPRGIRVSEALIAVMGKRFGCAGIETTVSDHLCLTAGAGCATSCGCSTALGF